MYLTLGNLSYKIQRSRVRLRKIIVNLISIYKKDLFDVKIEIYYQTMRIITKSKYNNKYSLDKFLNLHFEN